MGRTMPSECDHGVVLDWGDFGPCQDCSEHGGDACPNFSRCGACEAETEVKAERVAERLRRVWAGYDFARSILEWDVTDEYGHTKVVSVAFLQDLVREALAELGSES